MNEIDKTKMMEDNIGLVYKFCYLHNITDEDKIQEVAYAYCRAVKAYDIEKAQHTLGTYAFTAMKNRMYTLNQVSKYPKRTPPEGAKFFSLDQKRQATQGESGWEHDYFGDVIGYDDYGFERVDIQDIIDKIRPKLTKKQLKVFDLLIAGNTRNEVAKILNRSNQAIQQAITRMKDIILEEVGC